MPRTMKPKSPARATPGNGAINTDDAVARRAYEIFESRGAQHGYDLDHWLEAERELKPIPAKPRKSKKTPQQGV